MVDTITKGDPDASSGGSASHDPIVSAYEREATVWSYEGLTGPEYWGDLCPEYAICRSGERQSPIDIVTSSSTVRGSLSFDYQPISPIRMLRTSWTVQVLGVPSCGVTIYDERYELQDFHFHIPAEHRMNGELTAMELHLVHQNAAFAIAVIGILIDEGAHNEVLGQVFDNLPSPADSDHIIGGMIDPAAFLPEDLSYYRYAGSRTTPPCSEGVDWFMLKERIECSAAQIGAFRTLFPLNSRPIQALNGREVSEHGLDGLHADDV